MKIINTTIIAFLLLIPFHFINSMDSTSAALSSTSTQTQHANKDILNEDILYYLFMNEIKNLAKMDNSKEAIKNYSELIVSMTLCSRVCNNLKSRLAQKFLTGLAQNKTTKLLAAKNTSQACDEFMFLMDLAPLTKEPILRENLISLFSIKLKKKLIENALQLWKEHSPQNTFIKTLERENFDIDRFISNNGNEPESLKLTAMPEELLMAIFSQIFTQILTKKSLLGNQELRILINQIHSITSTCKRFYQMKNEFLKYAQNYVIRDILENALELAITNHAANLIYLMTSFKEININMINWFGDNLLTKLLSHSIIMKDKSKLEKIVQILIERGINVNWVGEFNKTALNHAEELELEEIKKLLIAAGAKFAPKKINTELTLPPQNNPRNNWFLEDFIPILSPIHFKRFK